MQPFAAFGVRAPRGPGRQEVDAHAETGFEHGERSTALPSSGQTVALQKYVVRLGKTAHYAVIDIAVFGRIRRPIGTECKCGGNQRIGHAGRMSGRDCGKPYSWGHGRVIAARSGEGSAR